MRVVTPGRQARRCVGPHAQPSIGQVYSSTVSGSSAVAWFTSHWPLVDIEATRQELTSMRRPVSSATTHTGRWIYGILIGIFHRLTGLGFETSASLLNALLMMLTCVLFVRIYEEIKGEDRRLWVAALLVLALPILNDYRDFVIRGFGFLAFMLLALLFFIRYSRSPDIGNALKWQAAVAVAVQTKAHRRSPMGNKAMGPVSVKRS